MKEQLDVIYESETEGRTKNLDAAAALSYILAIGGYASLQGCYRR